MTESGTSDEEIPPELQKLLDEHKAQFDEKVAAALEVSLSYC